MCVTELRFKNRFVNIIFLLLQLIYICRLYIVGKLNILYLTKIKAI